MRGLAEVAGVAKSTLQRIEHGNHGTLRLSTVERVARALGVKVFNLLVDVPAPRYPWDGPNTTAHLAGQLRLHRERKGLTQEALSEGAKVPRAIIAKIETRMRNPAIQSLEQLAQVLDVAVAELVLPIPPSQL